MGRDSLRSDQTATYLFKKWHSYPITLIRSKWRSANKE